MKQIQPINLSYFNRIGVVKGEIYDTKEVAYLVEDLIEIILSEEYYVDIGWYPDRDINGQYVIRLWKSGHFEELVEMETTDVYDALACAYFLADSWTKRPIHFTSSTGESSTTELQYA